MYEANINTGGVQQIGWVSTCHYDESSECAHVSIHAVACYRTDKHPNSVLDLPRNEVDGGGVTPL